MRSFIKTSLIAALTLCTASVATAELQNVEISGQLRIRSSWYTTPSVNPLKHRNPSVDPIFFFGGGAINPNAAARSPFLPFRPLGARLTGGIIQSPVLSLNGDGNALDFVEQRTRLGVKADFTEDVTAFIELDSYDIWGEDFRANYIFATDNRAASVDDVEIYQAYIQADEMYGYPLRLRAGRQELQFGSEWLVGNADTAAGFVGLSFDGLRLTYDTDAFAVDAWAALLNEAGILEEDGDTYFYGVYGTFKGLEDVEIDAYWMYVRDPSALNDTQLGIFGEWVENIFGVDDYPVTTLHTLGLRGAGTLGAFDFEAEAAYQMGDAGQQGFLFAPNRLVGALYGDDEAEFSAWAANLQVGYTFDMAWTPHVYIGGAYFDGEDNRDITFWQWVAAQINPFWQGDASVSFNRLFSDWEYSEFLENGDLSNAWVARAGISVNPTEQLEVLLTGSHFRAVEVFDDTRPDFFLFGNRVTFFAPFSWITEENDDDLGTEVGLYLTYNYSEDLTFNAGWAHLFAGDGLKDGNFVGFNGLGFVGAQARQDKDPDYYFIETQISF